MACAVPPLQAIASMDTSAPAIWPFCASRSSKSGIVVCSPPPAATASCARTSFPRWRRLRPDAARRGHGVDHGWRARSCRRWPPAPEPGGAASPPGTGTSPKTAPDRCGSTGCAASANRERHDDATGTAAETADYPRATPRSRRNRRTPRSCRTPEEAAHPARDGRPASSTGHPPEERNDPAKREDAAEPQDPSMPPNAPEP